MLTSVLLHLDDVSQADPVIRVGVDVARRCGARLRGLTMTDTRQADEACRQESAVFAVMEQNQQLVHEKKQEAVRVELSRACLEAGLDFELRRIRGNPLQVLPREARYHDLVITSVHPRSTFGGGAAHLSLEDVRDLLLRGVQPLVLVPRKLNEINRVLLAYDGSAAAGRGIRAYLGQQLFPLAEHRLLAVGRCEEDARQALHEMADYCSQRIPTLETGLACGKTLPTLAQYAEKWQADMLVLGAGCETAWLRKRAVGQVVRWLTGLPWAVYVAA